MIEIGPNDLPQPSLESARLERQWSNVRERASSRPSAATWRWPVLSFIAVAACALIAWRVMPTLDDTTRLAEGSAVETTHTSMRVALEEGTTIDVEPESRVELASATGDDVAVSLDRGRAHFDVARRPSRAFRVQARTTRGEDVEVRVVGTAFTVAHDDDGSVSVEVERGIVEVRSGDELVRLTAGGSWRSHVAPADASDGSAVAPERSAGTPERSAGTPERSAGTPERSASSDEASAIPAEGFRGTSEGLEATPEGFDASAEGTTDDAAARVRRATRAAATPDARALFEQAREARQAGSIAEAARLYSELLGEHDDDPRADVAAFELGRLRMDHLGDPRGALRALDRALAGGGAFREDAMARRAVLLDRLGRDAECRSARDAYLAAFGAGVHRAEVGDLCP